MVGARGAAVDLAVRRHYRDHPLDPTPTEGAAMRATICKDGAVAALDGDGPMTVAVAPPLDGLRHGVGPI